MFAPSRVMPIVKANAYGLGIVPIVKAVVAAGADICGVAYVGEGVELREAGISVDILVLGAPLGAELEAALRYDFILTISSIEQIEAIENLIARASRVDAKKPVRIHLKVDTGMSRLGTWYEEIDPLIEKIVGCDFLSLHGVYSHLASAESDDTKTAEQISRFKKVKEKIRLLVGPTGIKYHCANTAGALKYPEIRYDYIRTGLTLIGVPPSQELKSYFHPAFSLVSKVSMIKKVPAGETVSYGGTYTIKKDTNIAVIPVGYGDGYLRTLSNKGFVLIHGKKFPIAGKVCMDQFMVDVGEEAVQIGDEVVLVGTPGQRRDYCSADGGVGKHYSPRNHYSFEWAAWKGIFQRCALNSKSKPGTAHAAQKWK